MTEPIDVVINTVNRPTWESLLIVALRVANLFTVSWVAMLLLGALTPIAPGYLVVVGLVWIYRAIQNPSFPINMMKIRPRV